MREEAFHWNWAGNSSSRIATSIRATCRTTWSLQEWKGEWREIHYGLKGESLKHETPAKVCKSCLLVPRTNLFDRWRGTKRRPRCNVDSIRKALDGDDRELRASAVTNSDGRCEKPLLADSAFRVGTYELVFHVGEHFAAGDAVESEPPFLDVVPVRFSVVDAERDYHVPLLVSAYGYSTYRGS